MSLVGAMVVPHPPIIVPEVGGTRVPGVQSTVDSMRKLGLEAAVLAPDVIVLLSPHAPLDADRMAVCLAERYRGSLSTFGAPQVKVDLVGEAELARTILAQTKDAGIPIVGYGEGSGAAPLDHGALVPLYFLLQWMEIQPRFVELNFSFSGTARHLEFGRVIRAVIDEHPESILYVASGDLSHRLTPSASAGYDPRGAEFDEAVVSILAGGELGELAQIPDVLVDSAGECGYRSLLVLAGVLEASMYETRVLSYEGPFGVGYLVGAIDVRAGSDAPVSKEARGDSLVRLARETVERVVKGETVPKAELPAGSGPERAGVFVSLHTADGSLRGCIGTLAPTRPSLAEEIVRNAVNAATIDSRFRPVRPEELDGLEVSVDVLGEPEPVGDVSQLDPKRYGIIVRAKDGRQALLLPDLEGVDTVEQQIDITCRKGKIDPLRDTYSIERFEVIRHRDQPSQEGAGL